ncbi:MAG: glutamine amidotransferase [Clostridia bacterium]|nr:glutamine amidotransferase [Clostridia bacterium]
MADYKITIVHLYPNLLNLYGDKGNIECMKKRLLWRGIDVEVVTVIDDEEIDFDKADIVFLGGGSERELRIVAERLFNKKQQISGFVENNGSLMAVCEGFELLGKYYYIGKEKTEGLGILDIYTEISADGSRFTGDVILECDGISNKVVGFENHGGITNINDYTPLGKVLKGNGNDKVSGVEGVIYKNVMGTHLHGPIFPKNPELCDKFLLNTLKHKYNDFAEFSPLNDEIENLANQYMVNRG